MVPDIKLKDYYLRYIYNAKNDVEEYQKSLNSIIKTKQDIKDIINENKFILYDKYDINLEDYDIEWNLMKYNKNEDLYKLIIKFIKTISDTDRFIFIQIIKYCVKLKEEYNTNNLIKIAKCRENLTLKEYKNYINKYYLNVHKQVLEGFAYKFTNGIGTFLITYYKIDNKTKPKIDFAATNKRKKELLEKGYKLYDEKEADWYKARNIPYNAVDYRVYIDKKFFYDINFINSKIFHKGELDYQRTEYVHAKFRGLSYQEIADQNCNNFEDIINLNVDIKYKLNILLYKYPEKHNNFIRNDEQSKYKY